MTDLSGLWLPGLVLLALPVGALTWHADHNHDTDDRETEVGE